MIDPDALRHLASDLDAKADACYLDARHAADLGDEGGAIYHESKGIAYADVADRIREILTDEDAKQRESTNCAGRVGYDRAVATLHDVARRTGSPAARWAAEYLAADPDGRAP